MEIPKREVKLIDKALLEKGLHAAKKAREEHLKKEALKKKEEKDIDKRIGKDASEETEADDESDEELDEMSEEESDDTSKEESEEKTDEEQDEPDKGFNEPDKEEIGELKDEVFKEKLSSLKKKIWEPEEESKTGSVENEKTLALQKYYEILIKLVDKIEEKGNSMRLEKSRLKVLGKEIEMIDKGFGSHDKVKVSLEKLKDDLKEEYQ
jgi:hypothetical protein